VKKAKAEADAAKRSKLVVNPEAAKATEESATPFERHTPSQGQESYHNIQADHPVRIRLLEPSPSSIRR
jgi:hypothetical protein